MSSFRAKVLTFSGSLRADGAFQAEDGPAVFPEETWTPEHLLLAALGRCVLKSLHHAMRGRQVTASARMRSTVTRRDEDGLYALVDADVALDVTIDPAPAPLELPSLLARAERGCFVGNSLRAKPRYRWLVNGAEVEPAR